MPCRRFVTLLDRQKITLIPRRPRESSSLVREGGAQFCISAALSPQSLLSVDAMPPFSSCCQTLQLQAMLAINAARRPTVSIGSDVDGSTVHSAPGGRLQFRY